MTTQTNPYATAPTHGFRGFDLLHRECLRIRIQRDHDVWADTEPVAIGSGFLPAFETKIERNVQYRGDGIIPDDLLP